MKHPSEEGGWIASDRLRSIFMAACAVKSPDTEAYVIEESYLSGLSIAGTNTWLESQRVDEWRPGMRSGSGWVTKYRVTPLGKRQVQRAGQPPQELVVAPKPAPKASEPSPWSKPRAQTSAQSIAIAAVKNEVSIAPKIVVNVHVPAMPFAAASKVDEASDVGKKARNNNGSKDPKEPSPGACRAAAQYQKAMDEHFSRWPVNLPSDDEVYAWLEINLQHSERAKLPKKDSWKRQLRNFRKAAGIQKKHDSRDTRRNG